MSEKKKGRDVSSDDQRKESVNRYASIIERHLKSESSSFSENEIVKEVLRVKLETQDDIPSSTNDLYKLTEIRESLRKLVTQRKIVQTLVQDPLTKEETMYYVIRKTKE
jgi:hypothetical protein